MDDKPTSTSDNAPSARATLHDLLVEMRQRDRLLQEYIETRSKIHSRWIVVVGIVAVIAGLWMAQLIHQMMDDMAIMSSRIVSMEGYMGQMQKDMGSMNLSMHSMEGAMVPMRGYMETMSGDMSAMRGDIAAVPQMQKDVNHMAQSVVRMQFDTGVMRHGVANMSNDMGSMSHPFNVLNTITPW
jgi:hypothetical protein